MRSTARPTVSRFELTKPNGTVLMTGHYNAGDSLPREMRTVVHSAKTGDVLRARARFRNGCVVGCQPKADPKAFKNLADKPAKEIVKKLQVIDFLLITGTHSSVDAPRTTYLVRGGRRSGTDRCSLLIDVDADVNEDTFTIAERVAGDDDVAFYVSENVSEAIPIPRPRRIFMRRHRELAPPSHKRRRA